MPDRDPPRSSVQESRSVPRKRTRLSLVWFIPILAAVVGAWVAVTRVLSEGPKITIVMKSAEGLEAGKTKIHYNGVDIGTVTTVELSKDHKHVTMTAQMAPKTESFLVEDTKLWVVRPRISGANITGLGTLISGAYIGVEIGSSKEDRRDLWALEMPAVLRGGIAFEPAVTDAILPAADVNTVFTLFKDRAEAFNPPPRSPQTYQLVFKDSVRGLAPGAPVEFRGIPIGEVASIRAQIDLKTFEFSVPVTIHLDPQRLGVKVMDMPGGAGLEAMRRKLIDSLVSHGVRAQLKTGNLLTGSAFVSLDFFPSAPPATVDWSQTPVQLPTTPGQLEATEAKVENIINKVDKMPLQEIGENMRKAIGDLDLTLVSARGTLVSAQGTLDNTNSLTEPNSAQVQQLGNTLQEVSRAARSVRVLADYLERHPEALIRGKQGGAK